MEPTLHRVQRLFCYIFDVLLVRRRDSIPTEYSKSSKTWIGRFEEVNNNIKLPNPVLSMRCTKFVRSKIQDNDCVIQKYLLENMMVQDRSDNRIIYPYKMSDLLPCTTCCTVKQ
mmetsp:Transcript_1786/g.3976  ORF Transcript_1786/g.3976 Transcript_1786/m.3976 type:complete len:114 (-) Transcript_1786:1260-1601(-)